MASVNEFDKLNQNENPTLEQDYNAAYEDDLMESNIAQQDNNDQNQNLEKCNTECYKNITQLIGRQLYNLCHDSKSTHCKIPRTDKDFQLFLRLHSDDLDYFEAHLSGFGFLRILLQSRKNLDPRPVIAMMPKYLRFIREARIPDPS